MSPGKVSRRVLTDWIRLGPSPGVLQMDEATTLERLAGYRNRMVRFYHEVNANELYEIASSRIGDVTSLREALLRWVREHPHLVDDAL